MLKRIMMVTILLACNSFAIGAESTGAGKILATQGHVAPACRMVLHKSSSAGLERWFRIPDAPPGNDISTIVMTALVANRDVEIFYEPGETTGCGTEPRIIFITLK